MDAIDLTRCTLQPRTVGGTGPHGHPEHEFHLVVQGAARFRCCGRSLPIAPGSAWYTRPRTVHQLSDNPRPLLQYVVWARLPAPLARQLDRDWGEGVDARAGTGSEDVFWTIQEGLRRGTPHARLAAAHAFAAWLHGVLDRLAEPRPASPDAATRMRAYLEENLDRPVTLAALAQSAGISRAHADRLFHRTYGQAPLAWLRHRRLALAVRWLRASDLPVQEIAARVGFQDPLYFSRALRAWCGRSPLAVRRSSDPVLPAFAHPA